MIISIKILNSRIMQFPENILKEYTECLHIVKLLSVRTLKFIFCLLKLSDMV